MEGRTVRQARKDGTAQYGLRECRHMLESCGHKLRATEACGRYAVSGGRLGHLAWSLL